MKNPCYRPAASSDRSDEPLALAFQQTPVRADVRPTVVETAGEITIANQPTQGVRGPSASARRWNVKFGISLALGRWCLSLLCCSNAQAQTYSIDWYTIDGGGGVSTGGVYSVSGTIGQPDAGTMSGGNFSLTGGFWSLLSAVQTPGAPLLTITLTSTNTALVSWPFPSSGFNLQQSTNLNATNWVLPPQAVTNNGTINFIIVNPPVGQRFYRLFKP